MISLIVSASAGVRSPAWKELVGLAPHVFWFCALIGLILFIGPNHVRGMILSARKVAFAGFDLELTDNLAAAVQKKNLDVPRYVQERVARRLQQMQPLVACARILWVDDNPLGNSEEISILNKLGATIDIAETDEEAKQRLRAGVYDLVLSDMHRGDDPRSGERLIPSIRRALLCPKVIFYVGQAQEAPAQAFGLTTKPNELLDLVLDALEKKRG